MTRFGNVQMKKSDLLWRKVDLTRDKPQEGAFAEGQLIPVRAVDVHAADGIPMAAEALPCLPDLFLGPDLNTVYGPWRERRDGWSVRYTRTIYLVENGVLYTGAERKNELPAGGILKSALTALTVLLVTILGGACTNETDARRALESEGFEHIEFTGYEVWACAEDDLSHTGFKAINSKGMRVQGTVCCGWVFKNCTVRF